MILLGIDPGKSGALCLYDTETPDDVVAVLDMPTFGEDSTCELDALFLFRWLTTKNFTPARAFIENVFAMPSIPDAKGVRRGMGATSAFRFGGFVFAIRAVVRVAQIPVTPVVPRVWKKHYGITGSDKEQSRQEAIRLFPKARDAFGRKMDHQRAEACLIARYGAVSTGALL